MAYCSELEERLEVKNFIDRLEQEFDRSDYSKNLKNSLNHLRKIKLFLYREWDQWKPLSEETMLDSTDCLSLVTIVHLLASRKGIDTTIVRPKNLSRYFHAMLSYESENGADIFKVAGRYRKYDCLSMGVDQVERRIKYIRPLVNLVNSFRFGNNVLSYSHQ